MNKFEQNLVEVKRADLAAVELFKKRGNNAYLNPARNYSGLSAGDIIVNGQYVENKVDWESIHTDNICIEGKSLDRTADWFLYFIPEVYLISKPKLKVLASMSRQVTGGDYGYKLYLPTKQQFIKQAHHLNGILENPNSQNH